MKTAYILALACLLAAAHTAETYRKIIHETEADARCLDGSAPIIYVHEGSDKSRFVIFFIGGGLCSGLTVSDSIEDCYQRSKTNLGSSSIGWPDTISPGGILSTDPNKSKFAGWTKIVFGYCDGSMHQGYRKNPISYKGVDLYFRGAAVTRSNFKWVQTRYNLRGAEQVILTGSSAGGVATFLWTNYLRTLVSRPNNVVSIPDSGVFLNFTTYQTNEPLLNTIVVNNFKMANIDEKTPLGLCNLKYKNEEYKCLFFEYAFTSIEARTLVINSEYDAWAISNALKISCLSKGSSGETLAKCDTGELDYIERYHQKFRDVMEFYTMVSRHSVWSIGCSHHGYNFEDEFYDSQQEKSPATNGMTLREAVEGFVLDEKRIIAEESTDWPANAGCAK